MVEVTEMFYGKAFALDKADDAKEFAGKTVGVKGWISGIENDKRCFRTYFTFKSQYKNTEEYEKCFTVMNNDFVKGLELLGYTATNFDSENIKVSVLEST